MSTFLFSDELGLLLRELGFVHRPNEGDYASVYVPGYRLTLRGERKTPSGINLWDYHLLCVLVCPDMATHSFRAHPKDAVNSLHAHLLMSEFPIDATRRLHRLHLLIA